MRLQNLVPNKRSTALISTLLFLPVCHPNPNLREPAFPCLLCSDRQPCTTHAWGSFSPTVLGPRSKPEPSARIAVSPRSGSPHASGLACSPLCRTTDAALSVKPVIPGTKSLTNLKHWRFGAMRSIGHERRFWRPTP